MEGAAAIMGNSVAQWKATYAPTLKRRRAQEAADNFLTPRRRMVAGVPAVAAQPEEEEQPEEEQEREEQEGEDEALEGGSE